MSMQSAVLWVVTPSFRRDLDVSRMHIAFIFNDRCKPNKKAAEAGDKLSASATFFLLGLHFEPEDAGNMFLRNVEQSTKSTALQPVKLDCFLVL